MTVLLLLPTADLSILKLLLPETLFSYKGICIFTSATTRAVT